MPSSSLESPWGRLLIAGGTDFATLGRKDKSGKNHSDERKPDLPGAHIARNVANIKFKGVFTSHSGCHAVAITLHDEAYLVGRNDHHQLTHPLPGHFTDPHLTSDGLPSPSPAALFPFPLAKLPESNASTALKSQKIVSAAVGRAHTVLITEKGEAWTCGWNNCGQCGHEGVEHVSGFKRVTGDLVDEKVVQASCGTNFTLFLTESGRVYAVGTGEKGVLGNGRTGEHIAASKVFFDEQSEPLLVEGALADSKIVQITSGQQHSMALDDEGFVYAWGFGGLGRLGLGAQMDVLTPTQVPAFAGDNVLTRAKKIVAGSTNTMFIDNQGMVLLCGKWKTSGDGSIGQPWMKPKAVPDIMGYKWKIIASGGVTLFTHTHDPKEGDFTVAWGQGASYGELALGLGAPKSATKPQRIEYLDGIEMLDIAAGQSTTFFIARPPPTEAAKEEARNLETTESVPTPAVPSSAPVEETPVDSPSSGAFKPSIDLSGFGFAFGAPPTTSIDSPAATSSNSKAASPGISEEERKQNALGISRTTQDAWEQLQRFPEIEESQEECVICGRIENAEKGESLECEKCEGAFHLGCVGLTEVPDGEWFCDRCDGGESSKKRKAEDEGAEEGTKKVKA
ncbi:uncharacterized protein JCM6883_007026 [Sporobolomyces salmoneus]|uniref:uncharacterized protein n=1 Tax=Sporobolomyces salmoneus TaxID=183962 RepID=UPI003182A66A